jgi:hypothetical protein
VLRLLIIINALILIEAFGLRCFLRIVIAETGKAAWLPLGMKAGNTLVLPHGAFV